MGKEYHNWYFALIFLGPVAAFGLMIGLATGLDMVLGSLPQDSIIAQAFIVLMGASIFLPQPIFMYLDMRHVEGLREHLGIYRYLMLLFVWFGSVFLYYWERRKVTKNYGERNPS